jgi:hypothetical protein
VSGSPGDADGPDAPADATGDRTFEHGGRTWVARVSGSGALGTGSLALGLVEAIHFADAAEPGRPLREALVARGRFEHLHDVELGELCDRAVPITAGRGAEAPSRGPRRPHAD